MISASTASSSHTWVPDYCKKVEETKLKQPADINNVKIYIFGLTHHICQLKWGALSS